MVDINPGGKKHLYWLQLHQPSKETKQRDEVEAAQKKLLCVLRWEKQTSTTLIVWNNSR